MKSDTSNTANYNIYKKDVTIRTIKSKQYKNMEENTPPVVSDVNNNQKQVAGAIILAGLLVAGAILLSGSTSPRTTTSQDQLSLTQTEARAVTEGDHIIGSPNAPVVIIEYSDTECPFCKVFHATMKSVVENNNGDVAWVYRHYPIPQLHAKAFNEAVATECAWEQGGNDSFWKYIDEVFKRTQSNDKLEETELPKIASDIGLKVASFNSCLSTNKYREKVEADMADGEKAGARGTPYSVIITQKEITVKTQTEILKAINSTSAVSFDSENKNIMTLNGALPLDMVNKIIAILLK